LHIFPYGVILLSKHNFPIKAWPLFDAAFLLDAFLSIYEHESTVCPNMPVRSLIYFSGILEPRLKKKNIYGRTLIKIPTPKFAVFYNGTEEQPEQYELHLSDAFEHPVDKPEIELTCRVYNINKGHNEQLLDRCPVLKEYMIFVDYVREYHKQNGYQNLEEAIEQAINRCVEENVLRGFLKEHRSEVRKMTQLDYTFERQIELEREAGREEGIATGREESLLSSLKSLMKSMHLSAEQAMTALEVPEDKMDFYRAKLAK
jgi:hypothetical protein